MVLGLAVGLAAAWLWRPSSTPSKEKVVPLPPTAEAVTAREAADDACTRLAQRDVDDVLADGLHGTVTWLVERTAEIATIVDEEFFHPPSSAPRRAVSQTQSQSQTQF